MSNLIQICFPCPLSERGSEAKRKALKKVILLVKEVEDVEEQKKILSGLIAFSDKVINWEDMEEIRRMIHMTKFDQIINEEIRDGVIKEARRIAENLLMDGASLESVSRNTGLDMSVVEELSKKISEKRETTAVTV